MKLSVSMFSSGISTNVDQKHDLNIKFLAWSLPIKNEKKAKRMRRRKWRNKIFLPMKRQRVEIKRKTKNKQTKKRKMLLLISHIFGECESLRESRWRRDATFSLFDSFSLSLFFFSRFFLCVGFSGSSPPPPLHSIFSSTSSSSSLAFCCFLFSPCYFIYFYLIFSQHFPRFLCLSHFPNLN